MSNEPEVKKVRQSILNIFNNLLFGKTDDIFRQIWLDDGLLDLFFSNRRILWCNVVPPTLVMLLTSPCLFCHYM